MIVEYIEEIIIETPEWLDMDLEEVKACEVYDKVRTVDDVRAHTISLIHPSVRKSLHKGVEK